MTNKKFKLAAMSMALTACVAAQPLMANAADDVDASQNVSPAPQEESTGSSAPAASSSSAEEKKEDAVAVPVVEESKDEKPAEQNESSDEGTSKEFVAPDSTNKDAPAESTVQDNTSRESGNEDSVDSEENKDEVKSQTDDTGEEKTEEDKQLPAFGTDSDDVKIDYKDPEPDPDHKDTTITEGDVIDTSKKDETTGKDGKDIGDATKTDTDDPSSTTTEVTPSTDEKDILGKAEDGSTLVKGTETTVTEGTGKADSKTEITDKKEGDVTSGGEIDLDEELDKDKGKLTWDISPVDKDGNQSTIGGYNVDKVTTSEDGDSKEITLKKSNTVTKKDMSDEDIMKLLDATDKEEKDGKTYYTKTEEIKDKDGKVIGSRTTRYEVTGKSVTSTTDTTLTIKMEKGEKSGSEDIKTDVEIKNEDTKLDNDGGTINIADLIKGGDGVTEKRDKETGALLGYTVVKGSKTYDITFGESSKTETDLSGLDNDAICDLLNSGKDKGYYVDKSDREIYDKDGNKLTIDKKQKLLKDVTVSVTVTDTKGDYEKEWTPVGNETEDSATEKAKKAAVRNALENAINNDNRLTADEKEMLKSQLPAEADIDLTQLSWSYTVPGESGKTYTFTYTVDNDVDSKDDIKNTDEGKKNDVTITGKAYVSGSTTVWEETKSGDHTASGSTVGSLSKDYKTAPTGAQNVTYDTATGRVLSYEIKDEATGITKFYTFSYNDLTELDDKTFAELEKAALEKGMTVDQLRASLTEITWTYHEEHTVDKPDDIVKDTLTSSETNWEKTSDSSFKYKDKNGEWQTISGLKKDGENKYTKTVGTVTTTVEIRDETIDDSEIEDLLKEKYGSDISSINVKDGKAAFKLNGRDYTVEYETTRKVLSITTKETKSFTDDDDYSKYVEWVKKQLAEAEAAGEDLSIDGEKIEPGMGDDKIIAIIKKAVKYDTLSPEKLIELLETEKKEAEDGGKSFDSAKGDGGNYDWWNKDNENYEHTHVDLDVSTKVKDDKGNEYDAVVLDPTLIISKSSSDLVNNTLNKDTIGAGAGTKVDLQEKITLDQRSGQYEYQHEQKKDQATMDKSQFYYVTGKVAYDPLTTETFKSAEAAKKYLKDNGYTDEQIKQIVEEGRIVGTINKQGGGGTPTYKIYKSVAKLYAYGYTSTDYNTCEADGYDLLLSQLNLVDGKVYAKGDKHTATISRSLKKQNDTTTVNSATYKDIIISNEDSGTDRYGSYDVKYTQNTSFTDRNNGKGVDGSGNGMFTLIKKFVDKIFHGSASGTQYEGELKYTYKSTKPEDLDISAVSKETKTTTVAHLDYNYTTTSETETIVVIPPETPDGDDDPIPPVKPETPPVQDATPDPETPVTPENPELPPVQDARPDTPVLPSDPVLPAVQDAHALPQTGVNWLAAIGMALSGLTLMITGAFTSLTYKDKH